MAKILKLPNVVKRASENAELRNRQATNRTADILIFPGVRAAQLASLLCNVPEAIGPRWTIDARTKSDI